MDFEAVAWDDPNDDDEEYDAVDIVNEEPFGDDETEDIYLSEYNEFKINDDVIVLEECDGNDRAIGKHAKITNIVRDSFEDMVFVELTYKTGNYNSYNESWWYPMRAHTRYFELANPYMVKLI